MPASRKQDRAIRKILKEGVFTTTDPQGQINVFRQYQDAGLLPFQYDTPRELNDALFDLIKSGKTKKEALAELDVKLGASFFDNKGDFNQRVFRDAQSPALVDAWNQRTKGLTAQQLSKLEAKEWGDLQKYYQEVGRRLGMKLDIGHFRTSASGAPGNVAAASGENAKANQAAGRSKANPFRPQTPYEEANIGMALNKVEGLGEAAALAEDLPTRGGLRGSPLNPYISVLLGTNLDGQSSRLLPESNLESLNFEFDRLAKSGANPVAMYDYIRERAGENININDMARAGQEQYDISKFAPSIPEPNAGPLRTIQPATKKGPTVTTKGVPKGLMPDRNALRAMAAAGIMAPSVFGSMASAAETTGRVQLARQTGNPVDWMQAGLAGASSAGDIAGYTGIGAIPGEVMSTAADLANVAIDSARMPARRPSGIPTAARSQARTSTATAARTRGQTMPKSKPVDLVNEAKYFIINPIGSAFNKVFGNRGI